MTPNEILEIDAQRNHPPGTLAGHLRADINDELRKGGDIVQQGNVLIVFRAIEPGIVEHHSYNADTPQNLLEANKSFWNMLRKAGAKIARTQYVNPKINKLLEMAKSEFDISITKDGNMFVSEVRL